MSDKETFPGTTFYKTSDGVHYMILWKNRGGVIFLCRMTKDLKISVLHEREFQQSEDFKHVVVLE